MSLSREALLTSCDTCTDSELDYRCWRAWNTATTATISIQRCCLTGVLSKEVITRNAVATPPRTWLDEGSTENLASFVFLLTTAFMAARQRCHHSLLRVHLTLDHVAVSGPDSGSTSTPLVPSTRRPLGDRAFPVAAALAWNALLSSVRT